MFCSVSWECRHYLTQCLHCFAFPPPVREGSSLSSSSSTLSFFRFSFLFGSSSSNGYEVTYSVGLICISLITSNVKHLFMSSLVSCLSSLERCLFRSFAHFWLPMFIYKSSVSILDINPVLGTWLNTHFLPFCELPFCSVVSLLWCIHLKILMQPGFSFFSFVVCDFSVIVKKSLPNPMHKAFTFVFFSTLHSLLECL